MYISSEDKKIYAIDLKTCRIEEKFNAEITGEIIQLYHHKNYNFLFLLSSHGEFKIYTSEEEDEDDDVDENSNQV